MPLGVRWGSGAALALVLVLPDLSAADPPARAAYVISTNDAQIARVDLDTGAVLTNLASVGSIANRIEVSADGGVALVVNSGSDEISVLDLETESVTRTLTLPAGTNPWTVEILEPRAFVTALLTDRLYEIDLTTGAIEDSAGTGVAPEGMCIAGGKLYVANTGFHFDTFLYDPGTVSVFDLVDLSPLATVDVGLNPQECLLSPDGGVHVICTGDFFQTPGSVHVIDPAVDAPVDTLTIAGYPGGGAITGSGTAFLNVTTFAFGSEVWSYEVGTLSLRNDGSNPLLPSSNFYGNLRVDEHGELFVPDFSADLLLRENPEDPGSPGAYLVGDGPVDLAIVDRSPSVHVAFTGLSASNVEAGIRLTWQSTVETDFVGFAIGRRAGYEASFRPVATDLPVIRKPEWVDRATEAGVSYSYRVGGADSEGNLTWLPPITLVRTPAIAARLAVERVYPMPSREGVTIQFRVPHPASGRVELFDARGRRIAGIADGRWPAGVSRLVWDGRDGSGRRVSPGLYFARLEIGSHSAVARVLVLR